MKTHPLSVEQVVGAGGYDDLGLLLNREIGPGELGVDVVLVQLQDLHDMGITYGDGPECQKKHVGTLRIKRGHIILAKLHNVGEICKVGGDIFTRFCKRAERMSHFDTVFERRSYERSVNLMSAPNNLSLRMVGECSEGLTSL